MVSFRDLWELVVDTLRTNAADIGVDPASINPGIPAFDKGRLTLPPMPAPFIYVACMPSDSIVGDNGSRISRNADIAILIAPAPTNSVHVGFIEAVELAERVEFYLNGLPIKTTRPILVTPARLESDNIRVILEFQATYQGTL